MKKFLQIGLMVAMFLSVANVYGNEVNFTLKIKSEKEKFIRFSMLQPADVHLLLTENNEDVLYEEDIHADAATSKLYDLNALPDGDYMLCISSETKLAKYKVVIENGSTTVSEPLIVNALKPALIKVDNEIILNLNNTEETPVEIEVFNDYNESLYKETFLSKEKFQKKFNISRTDQQSLTFVVKVNDQKFVKTIELF